MKIDDYLRHKMDVLGISRLSKKQERQLNKAKNDLKKDLTKLVKGGRKPAKKTHTPDHAKRVNNLKKRGEVVSHLMKMFHPIPLAISSKLVKLLENEGVPLDKVIAFSKRYPEHVTEMINRLL